MSSAKLLAGALLAGMGIATGQATLVATAAAVGANWLAEGLAGLWPALAGRAPDPLANAYAAAIRSATTGLEAEYRRTVDPRASLAAFALVAACADQVAAAQFPPDVTNVDAAQRALAAGLAALLHGHDERQVAYLRQRLLAACAVAFQQRLVQDEAAWRGFHGLLLQALAANTASLLARMDRFSEVLAAWSSPEASLAQLQRIEAQLTALARQPASSPRPLFDNRGLRVAGSVFQAAGNQYFGSAHAQGGGTAHVVNVFGPAPAPAPVAAPVSILFLAANPLDLPHLRLDQEARGVDEALRRGRHGGRFALAQHWAVRSGDLLDALLRRRPAIVHFAGHGDAQGRLLLEDEAGQATPSTAVGLAALLGVSGGVRCVVLNACWTDALAETLLTTAACVVGMANDVDDEVAIAFAAGFYRALADGASVAAAVDAGRGEALVAGGEDAAVAVRLRPAGGVDPAMMHFAG